MNIRIHLYSNVTNNSNEHIYSNSTSHSHSNSNSNSNTNSNGNGEGDSDSNRIVYHSIVQLDMFTQSVGFATFVKFIIVCLSGSTLLFEFDYYPAIKHLTMNNSCSWDALPVLT